MPSIDVLITFVIAVVILVVSPGPSNLYIMARSMGQGYQAGFAAASGMALGSTLYVIATALGLAALFKYSPTAYILLKISGALYLLYLGIHYFRQAKVMDAEKPHLRRMQTMRIFRQSVIVELTNPKTALFFLAFLPQFVNAEAGNVSMQLLLLGLIYAVVGFISDVCVALLSTRVGKWLSSHPAFSFWQDRISGTILCGLGGAILFQEWRDHS
jgi:threonine/homoserine/homoserine lactone efflux protein